MPSTDHVLAARHGRVYRRSCGRPPTAARDTLGTAVMTAPTAATEADGTLKDKHRAMWALGDYPALAADIIPGLGQILADACAVRAGDRVLDVAAGSGNAAIPAR